MRSWVGVADDELVLFSLNKESMISQFYEVNFKVSHMVRIMLSCWKDYKLYVKWLNWIKDNAYSKILLTSMYIILFIIYVI